jgi:ankyrin repeat protein
MMGDSALRTAIDAGDVKAVQAILARRPDSARETLAWSDGRCGASRSEPLSYTCLARFHGLADHDRMGDVARALVEAGAPADGEPGARETPLVTAASYAEADVARALIGAGAELEARGFAAPGATALAHAAYFGNPEVAALLVAAGAHVDSLAESAAAGDLGRWAADSASDEERSWALRAAAVCERIEIVDLLLVARASLRSLTDEGGTALHWAAWHGKPAAVRHLVGRGADPVARDSVHGGTPLAWCQYRHRELFRDSPGHDAVEGYLEGVATGRHDA